MPHAYRIVIREHVDPGWADWFGETRTRYNEDDNTVLEVLVPDQPALHGILDRIRDLNLILISVAQISPELFLSQEGADT